MFESSLARCLILKGAKNDEATSLQQTIDYPQTMPDRNPVQSADSQHLIFQRSVTSLSWDGAEPVPPKGSNAGASSLG